MEGDLTFVQKEQTPAESSDFSGPNRRHEKMNLISGHENGDGWCYGELLVVERVVKRKKKRSL